MSVVAQRQAEVLMAEGDQHAREGRTAEATQAYRGAALCEVSVLEHIPHSRPRTRGIIAVSAVTLFWWSGAFAEAIRYAHFYLADAELPDFAHAQLEHLLERAAAREQRERSRNMPMARRWWPLGLWVICLIGYVGGYLAFTHAIGFPTSPPVALGMVFGFTTGYVLAYVTGRVRR